MTLKDTHEAETAQVADELVPEIERLRRSLTEAEACLNSFTRAARRRLGVRIVRDPDNIAAFEVVNRELTDAKALLSSVKTRVEPVFRRLTSMEEEGWQ